MSVDTILGSNWAESQGDLEQVIIDSDKTGCHHAWLVGYHLFVGVGHGSSKRTVRYSLYIPLISPADHQLKVRAH
jgi:hypothetical protein